VNWQLVDTLDCGCEVIEIDDMFGPERSVRPTSNCVSHMCRKCGAVPAADAEPDRLCFDCMPKVSP
jgi:hypothetical protein